jgi:predicted dehydrogenase
MHSTLIIGCGSIGERHLRTFQQTQRTRVAVCDANAALLKSVADTYHVPAISDWEQAVAKHDFDSVVICAPAHLHVPMALSVLRAKAHVLIEKPLSNGLAGISELLSARDRAGKQAAVAYVLRIYPFMAQAREFLQKGELGSVHHVTVTCGQAFHRLRPAYAQTYYREHRTGGGAIQDFLTHSVNWVESIVGPTDSVICDCAHQVLPGVSVEDTVNVAARNGRTLVNYAINQFQAPNENTLQFHAEGGSVKVEFHQQRWGIFSTGDKDWRWHPSRVQERDIQFTTQANAFLDQIEDQIPRLCSLEAAIDSLRFNLACLESAKSGHRTLCSTIAAPRLSEPAPTSTAL